MNYIEMLRTHSLAGISRAERRQKIRSIGKMTVIVIGGALAGSCLVYFVEWFIGVGL